MKLVIEIPEEVYNNAKNDMLFGSTLLVNAIKNGKPQEPKTGHWKPFDLTFGRNIYYCTSCEHSTNMETVFKYCPNCGARMEGGAE